MNREILILIIVLGALGALGLVGFLTGHATDVYVSIGVDQTTKGIIIGPMHNLTMWAYYPLYITTIFRNAGSTEFDEQMTITIENYTTMEVLKTYQDGTFHLIPGEERGFKIFYVTNITGFYWIHVLGEYAGKRVHKYSIFEIVNLTYTPPGEEEGGGVPPPPPEPPEYGPVDMNLEYEKEITVSRGKSAETFVLVRNTGNRSLNDLRLLGSAPFPFWSEPKKIDKLSKDKLGVFLVTMNVTEDTELGEYFIDFYVKTDETNRSGQIKVNVTQLTLKEEVWRLIQSYKFLIQRIKAEIMRLSLQGFYVSNILDDVEGAEGELIKAEGLYEDEEYFKAMDQLKIVRSKLIKIIETLALLGIPVVLLTLPGLILLIVILIVISIAVMYFVFVYKRKRKPEKSEE